MIENYLKTAVRNIWRQKSSMVLNLAGLTLGIASSLVLFLLIRHHTTFDKYHTNKDRTYRLVTQSDGNTGKEYSSGVPPVLPDAFRNDFPEAETVTFISYRAGSLITIPQISGEPRKYEEEKGVAYAEPGFFRIFDRKILMGDPENGLSDPGTAVISEKSARKYFGREEVLGEVISYDHKDFKITAVMENYPSNTDFPFDVMLSMATIKQEKDKNGWNSIWSDEQCYFTLKDPAKVQDVMDRMPAFYSKYHKENRDNQAFVLQPLSEVHFDERYGNYNYNTVSRQMLTALSVIALFLVLTACINFVNITTAEAVKRSREVGIRKALGSSRAQLVRQFLGETSLVTVVAAGLALAVAYMALGFLNPFLEMNLALNLLSDKTLWIFLITLVALVSLLSGFYPSWMVSGYKVTQALKNQISVSNSSGMNMRRGLVVLQFFISQFFIIGTIVLINQMDYFQNKELGFRKDAIITVPIPESETPVTGGGSSKMKTLRQEITGLAGIEMASLNNTPPSSNSTSNTDFSMEGSDEIYLTQVKLVDEYYVKLFGLDLVEGINIQDYDTARGFLVNERLASIAGFKEPRDIVGKKIRIWGRTLPVQGVVRDFHTMSLRSPIEATILFNRIRSYESLSIRIDPGQMQEAIRQIRLKWEAAYPEYIFSYEFLDESIRKFYETEKKMSVLLSIFTSMAIFIGCLGLFGLTTFMANQKTKEIGVRKVLGASVESIIVLFSREFVVLIGVGFILAAPVAWYIMNEWLNGFTYKIEIGPMVFLSGIALTLLIALATVGYRSYKAATVNPAQSLKSE